MNICVFCSHRDVDDTYTAVAQELATLIAKRGHTLVWGGTNTGTMKVIADAAQKAGGRIIGVSMELFKDKARTNADEMLILPTLAERKAKLIELADALIALPGGLGTLDEITEVLELKKEGTHAKQIILLNSNDFYAGLEILLKKMDADGFLPDEPAIYAYFADTPVDAMRYIERNGNSSESKE